MVVRLKRRSGSCIGTENHEPDRRRASSLDLLVSVFEDVVDQKEIQCHFIPRLPSALKDREHLTKRSRWPLASRETY